MKIIHKLKIAVIVCFLSLLNACNTNINSEDNSGQMDIIKYGENYRKELEKPNQENIFGMDYLSYEWYGHGIDYVKGYKTLANMGVKSIRNWMHFSYFFENPDKLKKEKCDLMHDMLSVANEYNFQIIGMNHVNWSIKYQRFCIGKEKYQTFEGSSYQEWLDVYEKCWYTLVKEFSEITYWEIDNELNNKDFMFIEGSKEFLTSKESAKISADMLFRASRAIHKANKDAITILGGIVDPYGLGIMDAQSKITMVGYLEDLYDEIESGEHGSFHPDDFFQVAAWHPYYYYKAPDDYFYEENNKIYEVIKRREGKDKKVFLTEIGWNEKNIPADKISECITKLYSNAKEKMPYVESIHYYRYFDNAIQGDGDFAGMFYDAVDNHIDELDGVIRKQGQAKPYAYVYQQLAKGTGSLKLFEKDE
ncbi:MAG: hypothetical protein SOU19_07845 [Candidatus Caccosoma sp.]|nr:hypothetical protein [Candidatus Caccosoma sp.]